MSDDTFLPLIYNLSLPKTYFKFWKFPQQVLLTFFFLKDANGICQEPVQYKIPDSENISQIEFNYCLLQTLSFERIRGRLSL